MSKRNQSGPLCLNPGYLYLTNSIIEVLEANLLRFLLPWGLRLNKAPAMVLSSRCIDPIEGHHPSSPENS